MKPKLFSSVKVRDRFAQNGCYVCRRNSDVIDFDVQVEGEGRLGICTKHVGAASRLLGWEKPELVLPLRELVERLKADLAGAHVALRSKEELISNLLLERDDLYNQLECATRAQADKVDSEYAAEDE